MNSTRANSHEDITGYRAAFDTCRVTEFSGGHLTPTVFHPVLERLATGSSGSIKLKREGDSFEGRPVFTAVWGTGPVSVLLWSQMHGDESTATRALGDLLSHLSLTTGTDSTRDLSSKLTLVILPMLNPDGAAARSRRTAQGIDMNRDALALRTPEARILAKLGTRIAPQFCFNLHDQELSTVGDTTQITALALLAPAFDHSRSDNPSRTRARRLASFIAGVASTMLPDKIARYDDGHEPRAFGDHFQNAGCSTVLVESGHIRGDGEKEELRKANFILLLASLSEIARGDVDTLKTETYDRLPENGKRAYEVIVRNVGVRTEGSSYHTDLGISTQVDTHSEGPPHLVDAGDLRLFTGLDEFDGSKTLIQSGDLTLNAPFDYRRLLSL